MVMLVMMLETPNAQTTQFLHFMLLFSHASRTLRDATQVVTFLSVTKTSGSAIAEGHRDALVSIEKLAIDERP